MQITPKQRRRAIKAHYLRQQGRTLTKIAERLNVSVATVRSDLQLVQTHWSQIAAAAADDLLLESLHLLQMRLTIAIKGEVIGDNAKYLTPAEYIRAEDARDTQLTALAREIRRTVQQVHQRAEQRPDQHDLLGEEPQELAETATESSQIEPPNPTVSSPEQEIVESEAKEEKIPQEPDQDARIDEAIQQLFDQITNHEAQEQEFPTQTYAEAAG
jgi:IS30 family transposase